MHVLGNDHNHTFLRLKKYLNQPVANYIYKYIYILIVICMSISETSTNPLPQCHNKTGYQCNVEVAGLRREHNSDMSASFQHVLPWVKQIQAGGEEKEKTT